MNKQEAIEKIEELKKYSCGALGDNWISLGIDKALNVVNQIDEPEKPVLSKEEAEWLEHLKHYHGLINMMHCTILLDKGLVTVLATLLKVTHQN